MINNPLDLVTMKRNLHNLFPQPKLHIKLIFGKLGKMKQILVIVILFTTNTILALRIIDEIQAVAVL